MTNAITPFILEVPQSELDDLAARLDRVRWPDPSSVKDGRHWTIGDCSASAQMTHRPNTNRRDAVHL